MTEIAIYAHVAIVRGRGGHQPPGGPGPAINTGGKLGDCAEARPDIRGKVNQSYQRCKVGSVQSSSWKLADEMRR